MESFRPIDPNSLEAQEALKSLLGSTLAQLNEIDKNIVGSSSNIRGVKTDLRNVLANVQAPPPPPPPVYHQPAPVPMPVPVQQVVSVPPVEQDPNQLVFDFNQPITPDTINSKLDSILDKLRDIIAILKT
ncbi:MAG: hypothetical protein EBU90_03110 [Proteobacteria bacterium]|nr:hypothetical protein [Pseudomonadota bacterium]NBP13315.1 hypothetical protein [bacterium]